MIIKERLECDGCGTHLDTAKDAVFCTGCSCDDSEDEVNDERLRIIRIIREQEDDGKLDSKMEDKLCSLILT